MDIRDIDHIVIQAWKKDGSSYKVDIEGDGAYPKAERWLEDLQYYS